ncbi:MAG: type II toxin-antitoxin system HicA family toxin [Gemmatimonadales bacterium]
MNSREIIAKLEAAGWKLLRVKGSHHVFGKQGSYPVVVPHPEKDVPIETIKRIEKLCGFPLRPVQPKKCKDDPAQ